MNYTVIAAILTIGPAECYWNFILQGFITLFPYFRWNLCQKVSVYWNKTKTPLAFGKIPTAQDNFSHHKTANSPAIIALAQKTRGYV